MDGKYEQHPTGPLDRLGEGARPIARPATGAAQGSLKCSICLDQMTAPFCTRCGHTFCNGCIRAHLESSDECPICRYSPITVNDIFPNFALAEAIHKIDEASKRIVTTIGGEEQTEASHVRDDLKDVNGRIATLLERKRHLEEGESLVSSRILYDFLLLAHQERQQVVTKASEELASLAVDIARLRARIEGTSQAAQREEVATALLSPDSIPPVPVIPDQQSPLSPTYDQDEPHGAYPEEGAPKRLALGEADGMHIMPAAQGGRDRRAGVARKAAAAPYDSAHCKKIITDHYADLQSIYFESANYRRPTDDGTPQLSSLAAKMSRIATASRLQQVATLTLGDAAGTSNIISSIEFDGSGRIFATAGVTRRIKMYSFENILEDRVEMHCPLREIACKSKISCLAWNTYISHQVASADYDGLVTIYDSERGEATHAFEEHEKRCWSVAYSPSDPMRLASASDDCLVKLWSVNAKRSIATIDGRANVCSVAFNPRVSHQVAFGSADHNIHVYDLRSMNKPLDVLKGHKKAVSYVRFDDYNDIISASTDCTLRRWRLAGSASPRDSYDGGSRIFDGLPIDATGGSGKGPQRAGIAGTTTTPAFGQSLGGRGMGVDESLLLPQANSTLCRTFSGHVNEKNFVGLALKGDIISCGSENNSIYAYDRDLSKPLAVYKFSPPQCPLTGSALESDASQFVSSLAWRPSTNMIVAANSQGHIRILELV